MKSQGRGNVSAASQSISERASSNNGDANGAVGVYLEIHFDETLLRCNHFDLDCFEFRKEKQRQVYHFNAFGCSSQSLTSFFLKKF